MRSPCEEAPQLLAACTSMIVFGGAWSLWLILECGLHGSSRARKVPLKSRNLRENKVLIAFISSLLDSFKFSKYSFAVVCKYLLHKSLLTKAGTNALVLFVLSPFASASPSRLSNTTYPSEGATLNFRMFTAVPRTTKSPAGRLQLMSDPTGADSQAATMSNAKYVRLL